MNTLLSEVNKHICIYVIHEWIYIDRPVKDKNAFVFLVEYLFPPISRVVKDWKEYKID